MGEAGLILIKFRIAYIYKFIRDIYHEKFPELESLIVSPLDYVKCVKKIKNEMVSKMCELSFRLMITK